MTHTTNRIHAQYNADHDINPDPQAPRVTWAEEGLADDVDALVKVISKLEYKIEVMQAKIDALELRKV
ncbi:MAG: hypothetical protein NTW69_06415 [Chloroflexi bacterium]|nr:hypothetical protein [Chloroflexota bacterium]